MGSVGNWLDRFCYKHPRFGIPNLMTIIIGGNILVYLMDMFSNGTFSPYLTFVPYHILYDLQLWRLVTFVFVSDASSLFFFAITCYLYYFIGTQLEREWGTAKFTMFYLIGVMLNIVVGLLTGLIWGLSEPVATASIHYVNLSLFFAFATLYPNLQFLLFFFIPVKAKWLAWFDLAIFVFSILLYLLQAKFALALLPVVAIPNYVIFFWNEIRYLIQKVRRRTSPQVTNFKKAQKRAKENKGYLHKCAVCGVTDAERPDLEFRYCSKCNGYYCYCEDHISNHVHIQ